jgi:hypothetical protein
MEPNNPKRGMKLDTAQPHFEFMSSPALCYTFYCYDHNDLSATVSEPWRYPIAAASCLREPESGR